MDGKSLLQYEDLHTLDESQDTYDHLTFLWSLFQEKESIAL